MFVEIQRVVACQSNDGVGEGKESGSGGSGERTARNDAIQTGTEKNRVLIPDQTGVQTLLNGKHRGCQTGHGVVLGKGETR